MNGETHPPKSNPPRGETFITVIERGAGVAVLRGWCDDRAQMTHLDIKRSRRSALGAARKLAKITGEEVRA